MPDSLMNLTGSRLLVFDERPGNIHRQAASHRFGVLIHFWRAGKSPCEEVSVGIFLYVYLRSELTLFDAEFVSPGAFAASRGATAACRSQTVTWSSVS